MSARRITDPKAIPVAGVDAHLPAVPPQQLTAQHLVQRFGSAAAWEAEHAGDGGPDAVVVVHQQDGAGRVVGWRRTLRVVCGHGRRLVIAGALA